MRSPLTRCHVPMSGHDETVPFEESLFRQGGGETIANCEHQRSGALGSLVPSCLAGLYSQILADREHDVSSAQQFPFAEGLIASTTIISMIVSI
jgi:hypothetical protein